MSLHIHSFMIIQSYVMKSMIIQSYVMKSINFLGSGCVLLDGVPPNNDEVYKKYEMRIV